MAKGKARVRRKLGEIDERRMGVVE